MQIFKPIHLNRVSPGQSSLALPTWFIFNNGVLQLCIISFNISAFFRYFFLFSEIPSAIPVFSSHSSSGSSRRRCSISTGTTSSIATGAHGDPHKDLPSHPLPLRDPRLCSVFTSHTKNPSTLRDGGSSTLENLREGCGRRRPITGFHL